MELSDFIKNFAEQFDDTDASEFKPETEFKELDEWTSLLGLSILAMVDDEYDIQITADDLRNTRTIEELFNIVKSNE